MTLVLKEPRKGPATHALIVGVEQRSAITSGPFSAAATARAVADLLLAIDLIEAPLASVELIASSSPSTMGMYQNFRNGRNFRIDTPEAGKVGEAMLQWRTRLKADRDSIALFYYVGPTAAGEKGGPVLLIPAARPGVDGLDFENIWRGLANEGIGRQLYFIDECPAGEPRRPGATTALLTFAARAPGKAAARARFHARIPPRPANVAGRSLTPLSRALTGVVAEQKEIATADLAERLNPGFGRAMMESGYTDPQPIEALVERRFSFTYKIREPAAVAAPAAEEGKTEPKPAPPTKAGRRTKAAAPAKARRTKAAAAGEGKAKPEGAAEGKAKPEEAPESIEPEKAPESVAEAIARFTPRQRECLRLLRERVKLADIATRLGIDRATLDSDLYRTMWLLRVASPVTAARLLAEHEAAAERSALASRGGVEAETSGPPPPEPNTHFVSDDPEVEHDSLGRGPLAIALGRRLHRIWCRSNGIAVPGAAEVAADAEERAAFVLHLDSPWGGGKTSFGNFLARVLNPFPAGAAGAPRFLAERGAAAAGVAADAARVGTIFIDDPPADGAGGGDAANWPEAARRPWIVVPFNAWQAEHCAPPWWVFYQAIRKGCFRAVWHEGTAPAAPAAAGPPPRPALPARLWTALLLWRREIWWRLRNPKIILALSTFVITAAVTALLWKMDLIFSGERGPAFATGNALGVVLAGVSGLSGLWGLGALLRDSMIPGSDEGAERRTLGGGDPLERFRRHFRLTIKGFRRPVMVIVDDLDRCRPDFVVDLVRGIQTLLRSPRVVFVILGDRDWIERAFEAHHEAMKEVNVGPEQSFGARFVEKAIQMSFLLPEMPDARQNSYVRKVLLGPAAERTGPDSPPPAPAALSHELRSEYRATVAPAGSADARKRAEEELLAKYSSLLQDHAEAAAAAAAKVSEAAALADSLVPPGDGAEPPAAAPARLTEKAAGEQAAQLIGEERALLAAVDDRMEKALLHRLEPLARFFPPNPRQIKRIVNAITMYTCVAYLQMKMDEDDPRGIELAIWVIVMTEWPKTWRLLASCPKLADVLADPDPERALAELAEHELPGSRAATLDEVRRIRCDRELIELIAGETSSRPRLHSESARIFAELTPLHSRKHRLAEPRRAAAAAGGEAGGAEAAG